MNNRIGKANSKVLATVHEQTNGTMTKLTDNLKTEQDKNTILQATIVAAIPGVTPKDKT